MDRDPFQQFREAIILQHEAVLLQLEQLQLSVAGPFDGNERHPVQRQITPTSPTSNFSARNGDKADMGITSKLQAKKCPETVDNDTDFDGLDMDDVDYPAQISVRKRVSLASASSYLSKASLNSRDSNGISLQLAVKAKDKRKLSLDKPATHPDHLQGRTIEQALQISALAAQAAPDVNKRGSMSSLDRLAASVESTLHGKSVPDRSPVPTSPKSVGQAQRNSLTRKLAAANRSGDSLGTKSTPGSRGDSKEGYASSETPLSITSKDAQGLIDQLVMNAEGSIPGTCQVLNGANSVPNPLLRKGRGSLHNMVHNFLEVQESSCAARGYGFVINAFTIVSVLLTLSLSLKPPPLDFFEAAVVEVTVEVVFLTELVARFICIPDRWHFFRISHSYIDIFAALPLVLRVAIGFDFEGEDTEIESFIKNLLVTTVPVVRMLKLLRRFHKFALLQQAFADVAEALPVLGFTMSLMVLVFSCIIYLVEPRSNIDTLPQAMWLTVVTMTTVGYGDTTPESPAGYIVVALLMIVSALYMAMPLGIAGAAFTSIWSKRNCIILVKRTRDQMDQLGYSAVDIPSLFQLFDSDNDGELGKADFVKMFDAMNIKLKTEMVLQLFEEFDADGGGSVDAIEFIRQVFPKSYFGLYGHTDDEQPEPEDMTQSMVVNDGEGNGLGHFRGSIETRGSTETGGEERRTIVRLQQGE